ncbi:MAG: 50S ribosomal protein L5 [Candidatus Moranbacteria bacterium CG_4_9_14_3_um_filter_42_9]|nr:MAG: 50S ribosomal protein L5 [Candidatus Moranbacteria bacterium CG_4_9_14_3_um_filter_42_9]
MKNFKEKYNKEVISEMKKKFGFKNSLQVPVIEKVVVNTGIGKYIKDANMIKEAVQALETITGQKPVLTKSRNSIAGFKIREGLEVGVKVTLRGARKWDFLDRLVVASIPRIRDFQGLKESAVDEGGNLNIGIKEHTVFPEILPENVKNIMSLQVTMVTTARNRQEGMELFRLLGFPIKFENNQKNIQ